MVSVRSLFLFESSPDKFTILVRVMVSRNFFSICPFLWRKTVKCIYLVVLYVFFMMTPVADRAEYSCGMFCRKDMETPPGKTGGVGPHGKREELP